jgi:ubiquinone/menaquinone biosynthesis C-methylase UbiE
MKKNLKIWLKKVIEPVALLEGRIASFWAYSAHRRLRWVQWNLPPQPEHFDHSIDLYYQWPKTRISFWVERGVFGSLALKNLGDTLELACGDGFNSKYFYSLRSKNVTACDFDPKAIETAKSKNSAANIKYILSDIRIQMPEGKFDNIFWDAAIEHFTQDEIKKILNDIKIRLKEGGILSGYTNAEKKDGQKSLSHHEYEFKNKEDLLNFLKPYFKNVTVFETIFPTRHNLYFWASDGIIPFSSNWQNIASISKND